MSRDLTITVTLSPERAMALAQMCKRFGFDHAVSLSSPHDGGRERDEMLEGVAALQRSLREAGYAPR